MEGSVEEISGLGDKAIALAYEDDRVGVLARKATPSSGSTGVATYTELAPRNLGPSSPISS